MTLILLAVLMYFLPTIIGHNKRHAAGIFLVNFFLGWTVIGWFAALIWALSSEKFSPVVVVAGPGRFCSGCGTLGVFGARFCSACGRPV